MASLLLAAVALTVLLAVALERLLAYFERFDDSHR